MFYDVSRGHGFEHDPFKAIVTPRPIGWISSVGADGSINLAPYSFFNAVASDPPIVMFSSDGRKDTITNVEEMQVFCCNFVGEPLLHAMSATSAPLARGINEFDHAGLEMAPCSLIDVPRVAGAYAALECRVTQIIRQKDLNQQPMDVWTVFGQVIGVYIDEAVLTDGCFDLTKAKPVARLGYRDYAVVRDIFELKRPNQT